MLENEEGEYEIERVVLEQCKIVTLVQVVAAPVSKLIVLLGQLDHGWGNIDTSHFVYLWLVRSSGEMGGFLI